MLGRIALAQLEMGKHEAAETTLEMALAAVEQIELPYARSYAISRVAHAMIRFGRLANGGSDGGAAPSGLAAFARAVEIAGRIDDNRLRAHTLWTIAAAQRRAGDTIGAVTTETVADVATVEADQIIRAFALPVLAKLRADVATVDLVERAIAPTVERSAPHQPVIGRRRLQHRISDGNKLRRGLGDDGGRSSGTPYGDEDDSQPAS